MKSAAAMEPEPATMKSAAAMEPETATMKSAATMEPAAATLSEAEIGRGDENGQNNGEGDREFASHRTFLLSRDASETGQTPTIVFNPTQHPRQVRHCRGQNAAI
jgi:hypothetical protein